MESSTRNNEAGLSFERVFDAPPELVFACLTQPGHLSHFWAPLGASAPVEEIHIDPRPGGRFETLIVNDSSGATYATRSVFLEVQAPTSLVWHEEHSGMTVRITLSALPEGKTLFYLHQTNVPDIVRQPRNQTGFKTTLDKLADYVHSLAHGGHQ
ncbi:SRPBCC domain-containing protein [Paenarthrobacter sp. JL.01a]|uniref:SRPBCC family protein n=1 Tax=Paenarthrobacter sp. JL.01a TaxID=2979324 RepID=UPI0021C6FDF7|nr:SRPBCC domain-containing protein [Paenarthrobacter sp. JL.01a]UXM92231.1 SRPBCC domain-containing protein [Paenarthrobacter sp. JL.01a]